jgi:hypothetical protein
MCLLLRRLQQGSEFFDKLGAGLALLRPTAALAFWIVLRVEEY